MSKQNHDFSFEGGQFLSRIGAWWFVSYSYHNFIDENHLAWRNVKTAEYRKKIYDKTRQYHEYWLTEVQFMERLDVHGNSGDLSSERIKEMAQEVLDKISPDGGQRAIKAVMEKLQYSLDELRNRHRS